MVARDFNNNQNNEGNQMTPHWDMIPVVAKTVVLCSLWFGALDKKLDEATDAKEPLGKSETPSIEAADGA
jgi:hypothetical protein